VRVRAGWSAIARRRLISANQHTIGRGQRLGHIGPNVIPEGIGTPTRPIQKVLQPIRFDHPGRLGELPGIAADLDGRLVAVGMEMVHGARQIGFYPRGESSSPRPRPVSRYAACDTTPRVDSSKMRA
jgi:hypothetical protein